MKTARELADDPAVDERIARIIQDNLGATGDTKGAKDAKNRDKLAANRENGARR